VWYVLCFCMNKHEVLRNVHQSKTNQWATECFTASNAALGMCHITSVRSYFSAVELDSSFCVERSGEKLNRDRDVKEDWRL